MKLPEKRMYCPCDPVTGQRLWDFLKANGVPMYADDYQHHALGLAYYQHFNGRRAVCPDHVGLSVACPEDNATPSEFCAAFGLAWPKNTNQ